MWMHNRIFSYLYRQKTKTLRLITLGVFVHFVLFAGVMDIYFSSPVLHGLPSHKLNNSFCKRVVVFVSDGLRAEGIFSNNNQHYTPFLTSIKNGTGAWGVAHTRVPTESRPGHVAVFAGMYEDPHAVTKGWKYNPIDFDHVFNQSKTSFLWGSPDIIPIFNKDHLNKIYMEYYEPSFEDFSGRQSTILLDDWVFRKVKNYFQLNKTELYNDKNIFFLHLLGMDTAGHVYKPNSKKYFDNLKFVDDGIKDTVKMMDEFFNDNETTYIFTSDHGMTDWGSHGSGSGHETETPFIVWGARVKQNSSRQDLKQADITTIISILLGINIPINSVGVFQEQFFDLTEEDIANIMLTNTLTFGEQYKMQQRKMDRNYISYFYDEIRELQDFDDIIELCRRKIQLGKYEQAIFDLKHLINSIEIGKVYNMEYLRVPMLMCLAIGLSIFMMYIASFILGVPDESQRRYCMADEDLMDLCYKIIFFIGMLFLFLFYFNVEVKYCLYICFPFVMMLCLAYDMDQVQYLLNLIYCAKLKDVLMCALIIAGVNSLTLTFFQRDYIIVITIGVWVWILLGSASRLVSTDIITWLSITFFLPMFYKFSSFLNENNHIACTIGAVIIMYITVIIAMNEKEQQNVNYFYLLVLTIQFLCTLCSCINIVILCYYKDVSELTMDIIYTSSWTIFVISLITMTLHPRLLIHRVLGIQISLYNIYFLMSFKGEGVFLALFIYLCLMWCFTEIRNLESLGTQKYYTFGSATNQQNAKISQDDIRRCFVFMTFTLMSFYGAGNISDLNTFDPMWAKCFVKIFNPFLIAALIMFKLLIPFFVTTATFQAINIFGGIPTVNCFSTILLYSEIMVLNMMYRVTNKGSWLDIGLSISRFMIANVIAVTLLVIYIITRVLTENRLFDILSSFFHRLLGMRYQDPEQVVLVVAENPRDR